jgi:hypothetical protein
MLGDEVVLDVHKLALSIDPLECVASVAVFVAPSLGGAVITEKHEAGMVAFWSVCKQIKERIVVWKEVLGVAGLRSNNIRALNGITAKENRLRMLAANPQISGCTYKVEPNNVVIAFCGVEFDGETARVAGFVRVFTANCHGREADEDWCLLTNAT